MAANKEQTSTSLFLKLVDSQHLSWTKLTPTLKSPLVDKRRRLA